MYKIIGNEVIKISNNQRVAPCLSPYDVDFKSYVDWVNAGNQPEYIDVEPTPTPLTLAELKAQKISEINFAFEQAMNQVKTGYPQDEILTWSKQESEARAWLADNTAETPLLDAYVVVKSVTKANLVGAIIAKADMFASICGSLVGKRQYLEDVINGATLEGIANIKW